MPRPNATPRPVCRYYNTSRGCFAGHKCHYLHGDPSIEKYAPYEIHKTCVFYAQGYCKRGNKCWFKHANAEVVEGTSTVYKAESTSVTEEDPPCGICFEEKPALYGLLGRCSHAFCLTCIRQWRDPEGKGIDMQESGTHKTCPMCRLSTPYIVPSSRFCIQNDSRKAGVIEKYKQSMARVPCRYFIKSKPETRFCPFGRDCFYQHANPDGTRYEFAQGVDAMMRQWRGRRQEEAAAALSEALHRDPLEATLELLEDYAQTLSDEMDQPDEDIISVSSFMGVIDDYVASLMRREEEVEADVVPELYVHTEQPREDTAEVLPLADGVRPGDAGEPPAGRPPSARPMSPPPAIARPHTVIPHESDFHSGDPRTPSIVSGSTELVMGDYAWMMADRREADRDENCAP